MKAPASLSQIAVTVILVTGLAGCQSTGRLAEYDFAGGTLAAVYDLPPQPEVLTGPYLPHDLDDPIKALMRVGGRVAREVAANNVRERLDSAAVLVDVAARLTERTSVRAARFLRMELVDDDASADFGLEVWIREYGIDAEEWEAAARFFVDAEVILFDGRDGSEIWESRVQESDPMMPHIFGSGGFRSARDIVTAAILMDMSEEELARALEQLADYAADRISEKLRDSRERARGR